MRAWKIAVTVIIAVGLISGLSVRVFSVPPPPPPFDSITAPGDVMLTVTRGEADTGTPGTLYYTTSETTYKITVSAVVGSGMAVDGAKLSIKGGNLTTYTELITGNSPVGVNPTLKDPVSSGTDVPISNITLKLDAGGVAPGAAGLDTPWVYTVTYTMQ